MRYRANLIAAICFCVLAASAMVWGWLDAGGLRADSPGHATALIAGAIGLLLGLPVLCSSLGVNARVSATRAAPEGGWSVAPADIAALLDWQRRNGSLNEWRPTAVERKRGIAVCWAGEHLVVGGHYWRIAPGQYPQIHAIRVQLAQPANATLRYRQAWAHNMSSIPRLIGTDREFRFPAPDQAQARAFSRHFIPRLDGETSLARRRRRQRLSNWAFGGAAFFLVLLAVGFGFAWHDQANGVFRPTAERAVLIAVTVLGIMGTPILLLVGGLLRK